MKQLLTVVLSLTAFISSAQQSPGLRLWYRQPAITWTEALPVGNGRLGAMVFGRYDRERIQINEESVWAGLQFNDNNPNSLEVLDTVRQLLFADQNAAASKLAQQNMVAVRAEGSDSLARGFRSYQSLMDLNMNFGGVGEVRDYTRELDLSTGIAASSYERNGTAYTQEVFASAPDDVLMVRLRATGSGKLDVVFSLSRPGEKGTPLLQDARVKAPDAHTLLLEGQIMDTGEERGPEGAHMKFAGMVHVEHTGGRLFVRGDSLVLEGAGEAILYITGATNYRFRELDTDPSVDPAARCQQAIGRISRRSYARIRESHVKDHTSFMNRLSLQLGTPEQQDIPTDERLARVKGGEDDLYLTTLYFQYGRYLLLGSSRAPGVLPANLQGVWNQHMNAPWQSDFHTNINLQMNYWPAEVCNLRETTRPLFDFMELLREPGRTTAREMYGARGWTMHHCTDVFGKTSLQNSVWWGTFPMATGWMCLHFWEHYLFGGDKDFLRKKAYPLMREHARFLEDYLVEGPDGHLVTAPAYSPENRFIHPVTGEEEYLTYAPAMDNQIIREFLNACVEAAAVLGTDDALAEKWKAMAARIPATRLGSDGRILEWIKEYKEAEPGHRHISHLFGLHPGTQITPETPALFAGARKTLEYRLAHGGGHTGWSRAWIVNLYARLLDGDVAYFHFRKLLELSTLDNLFDTHPPFQIDGNFGGTAGLAEMLLQSQSGKIRLLPALPSAWKEGRVSGLRARGGAEASFSWKNGELVEARIRAERAGRFTVACGGKQMILELKKGEEARLDGSLRRIVKK